MNSIVKRAHDLGLLAALLWSAGLQAVEPVRDGQETFLKRAILADGRLWMLSDQGELSHVTESTGKRVVARLPNAVLDLCVRDGAPVIVTGRNDDAAPWTLQRLTDGNRWAEIAQIEGSRDRFVSLACSAGRFAVLTTSRLIGISGEQRTAVALKGKLGRGSIVSFFDTPTHLFVGLNAGEWGGGLRHISWKDGTITEIERTDSGSICGEPLDSDCDPINGIEAVPWKEGCVAAAVGLSHMMIHGRIVEVCDGKVEQLYSRTIPLDQDEAFFGLARVGNDLWAVGLNGLYRITRNGIGPVTPLPKFSRIDGFHVSFEHADLVLVLTDVNQRLSVSGSVPILVPRK